MVQTLTPGQDWIWCYVDEATMRNVDGRWVAVDLFFEAGIAFMREHLTGGGDATIDESFTTAKGFPLGRWVAEMRRREAADELDTDQRAQIDQLPGWRWDA
jgi:hypothetical protein